MRVAVVVPSTVGWPRKWMTAATSRDASDTVRSYFESTVRPLARATDALTNASVVLCDSTEGAIGVDKLTDELAQYVDMGLEGIIFYLGAALPHVEQIIGECVCEWMRSRVLHARWRQCFAKRAAQPMSWPGD